MQLCAQLIRHTFAGSDIDVHIESNRRLEQVQRREWQSALPERDVLRSAAFERAGSGVQSPRRTGDPFVHNAGFQRSQRSDRGGAAIRSGAQYIENDVRD